MANARRLLLAGDVMAGRGIDQAMPSPVDPALQEAYVHDARDYLKLAERVSGPIPSPVDARYVWGDALEAARRFAPEAFIVNLETAITARGSAWPGKGVHYRMHPAHADCLVAAGVDVCTLANNHVLDWGPEGLADTLQALDRAGIAHAGAGNTLEQAQAPAAMDSPRGSRLLVFSWATPDSGVPREWAATAERPGVALLGGGLEESDARRVSEAVAAWRRAGDFVVVSLHWGDNWVSAVPDAHHRFARRLIDLGAADLLHGHSSHHPLPVEVYRGRLVLHGCGDLLNDYEGIPPRAGFRSDLACLYAAQVAPADATLLDLQMVPYQLHRFRLAAADSAAHDWLQAFLRQAAGSDGGARLEPETDGSWQLRR